MIRSLFLMSLIVLGSASAETIHLPGNKTTANHMKKLQRYCDSLPLSEYYHWKCCGTEADADPLDYKTYFNECRRGVINTEHTYRSCSRICGGTAAKVYAYFSWNNPEEESVSAAYICECDIIVAGEKDVPPPMPVIPRN